MPAPVLFELADQGESNGPSPQDLFRVACTAFTRCVLHAENCSSLVDPDSYTALSTLDGVRAIRFHLKNGVELDPDFVSSDEVFQCISAEMRGVSPPERVALDTDESAVFALEAIAALLCVVLVALAVQRYRRSLLN